MLVEKKYYREIDIMKGISALAVVLVHSTPSGTETPVGLNLFAHCIMGLFFMVSGFVNARKITACCDIWINIRKQVRNLFVPYFIYSFLTLALKAVAGQYQSSMITGIFTGDSPNPTLWFLWTLFVVMVISLIVGLIMEKLGVKHRELCLVVLGVLAYIVSSFVNLGFFNKVLSCFMFVYMGVFARKYYDRYVTALKNRIVTAVCLIAVIIKFCIYQRMDVLIYAATIMLVWRLALLLCEKRQGGATFKLFSLFGNYSFDIYIFSYFAQVAMRVVTERIFHLNYAVTFVALFVSGLCLPLLIGYISKKFSLTLR